MAEPFNTSHASKSVRRTVLISGASFAGLSSAWWMNRLGYAVTVVETARSVRKGGTPVDIRDGVIDVVRRMGLLDQIAAYGLPPGVPASSIGRVANSACGRHATTRRRRPPRAGR